MQHARTVLVTIAGLSLLAGCSGGNAVLEPVDAPAMASVPVPDISGAWEWSRVEQLTMPAWVAQLIIGIQPEGPVTKARCESFGTMTLFQNGSSFTGIAAQLSIACETKGGQQFQPPDAAHPITVGDGRINGSGIRFDFNNPTVIPCRHHATIDAVVGGVATSLRGGGQCYVPGHPQSESPIVLPPPPAGTSKALSWQAARP